jgi:hypothetical protein
MLECAGTDFCLLERYKSGLGSGIRLFISFLIWLRIFEFQTCETYFYSLVLNEKVERAGLFAQTYNGKKQIYGGKPVHVVCICLSTNLLAEIDGEGGVSATEYV